MMDFYEPENEPKPYLFWLIMLAMSFIAVAFIAEIFISFYFKLL